MNYNIFLIQIIFFIYLANATNKEKEDIGYANDFVDEVLGNFRKTPSMVAKVDPLDIPDFKEGSIEGWDGVILGLSSLYRSGDCILDYQDKIITVTAEVAVRNIYVSLRYKAKLLFFNIRGKVEATVKHLAVKVVLLVKNGKAKLQTFKVAHLGKYSIKKITGLTKGFNWLIKVIANAVIKMSKKKIVNALENGAASAVNEILSKLDLPLTE